MKSDIVDLELMIHHATDKAILVSDDGDRKKAIWLPKSQIEMEQEPRAGRTQIISMQQYFAEEKGLV